MHQMNRTSRVFSFAVMAAVLGLTAACGSSNNSGSTSPTATSKGTAGVLNYQNNTGDASWVKTLDPAVVTDSVSISDIWMTEANLVKFDWPSSAVIPDLASNWTVSKDHKVYTFHIKPNAKFNNGDPVTAQDAVWSLTRALLPATKSPVAATYLGEIVGAPAVASGKAKTLAGVKVINSKTLQITLTDPIAYFLGTLAYPTGDILDKKVLQGKPAGSYLTNTCKGNVGAGPFEFVCQNGSSTTASFYPSGHSPFMRFKANPFYYGPKPKLKVYSPFIADNETNWRLFQSGAIDETVVPTADLPAAMKMPGYTKIPALETDYITPNQKQAPFTDINCRLAVAYAIDRDSITQKLLHGTEYPLYDVLPDHLPQGGQGYFTKTEPGIPTYNPTKAKAYLAKCPGGLKNVTLTFQNTSQDIVHEYDAVRANLQAIGANVTVKPLTFNAWLNIVGQPMTVTHTQITENLWIDDYPDAQDWLQNLLATGANYDIGSFSNPTFDSLIKKGNVEFNPTKRAADYKQAQKIALNDGAWIGVGGAYSIFVVRPKVHGIVIANGLPLPKHNDWSQVSVSG